MKYLKSLDGLRAIAVILVLAFHGNLPIFPSGFIGVDMFFVLSGFLITSIILDDLRKNNFSFKEFYRRRLWRLQPALIASSIFSILLAVIFYLPDDLNKQLESLNKVFLFTSNAFFSKSTTAYAAPDSTIWLLLHTWSLAIEWQWYLFLPIALYFLFKKANTKHSIYIAGALLVAFAIISLIKSQTNPENSYYSLISRAFEFMFGSFIVLTRLDKVKIPSIAFSIIGLIGFLIVMIIASMKNISSGYPNYYSIIICLATSLLIISSCNESNAINRALSIPAIVKIGVLSYSLYLWHWPLFSTSHYLMIDRNPWVKLLCYTLTFLLATISYFFIERPLRQNKTPLFKSIIYLAVMPLFIGVILFSVSIYTNGFPIRFGYDFYTSQNKIANSLIKEREACFSNEKPSDNECSLGNKKGKKTALMIGDSFSNHYWGFINKLAIDNNMYVIQRTKGACIALNGIYLFDWREDHNKIDESCYEYSKKMYAKIKEKKYDYVILGQDWNYYLTGKILNSPTDSFSPELTKKRYAEALNRSISLIEKSGATPVIMLQTYWSSKNQYACYLSTHGRLSEDKSCDLPFNPNNYKWINNQLSEFKTKHPNIIIIDPKRIQCNNNVCKSTIDNAPMFRDETHLTDYASSKMGSVYLEKFGNPFK